MLDGVTFSNQHKEDAINVKVVRTENDVDDPHELKDVKIVGVHKQQMPKRCFFFVILVMKSDGSNFTVYRKWKEIKAFQLATRKSTKKDPLRAEENYYLNNLRHKASVLSLALGHGCMKRLRLIDSLNVYFQALVHYKTLHQLLSVKEFFSPTESDLNSAQRCGGGKTYFYITDSVTNSNSDIANCEQSSESGSNQSDCVSYFSRESSEIDDGRSTQASSPTVSVFSTSSLESDSSPAQQRKTCQISSPMHGETYVALDDHEPLEEDAEQQIMSLKKGERVEVLMKNNSGWWFVRCSQGNCDEERTGFVPATYLARDHDVCEEIQSVTPHNNGCRNRLLSSSKSFSSADIHRLRDATRPTRSHKTGNRSYTDSPSSLRRFAMQQQSCEYISKRSHKAKSTDELSFAENSVLKILQKSEDGWWFARYKGREGYVPATFLQKYSDPLLRLSLSVLNLNVDL